MITKKKAIAYIDGFNFYSGLMHRGWGKYRWLDYYSFAQRIIPQEYELLMVRYFTSRVKGNAEKHNRQQKYIQALQAQNEKNLRVDYGNFQSFDTHCKICGCSPVYCQSCGSKIIKSNEKQTDVNLATAMFADCVEGKTDCIVLVSGDSDYTAPLREIHRLYPQVFRYIVFPPRRRNPKLYNYCDDFDDTSEADISNAQLPNLVINPISGKRYRKPPNWN